MASTAGQSSPVKVQSLPTDEVPVIPVAPIRPGIENARSSDFTLPLYPDAHMLKSGRVKGISPADNEMLQATMEMYTLDSIDDVLHYFRKRKRHLTVKDFDTDRGRNVIISDLYGIVPLPGPECRKGTTLILSRDSEKGRTRLVYTNFSIDF